MTGRLPDNLEIGRTIHSPVGPNMRPEGGEGSAAAAASPKTTFGEVYQKIQAQYGEKPEKPREIKKALGKDDFLNIHDQSAQESGSDQPV